MTEPHTVTLLMSEFLTHDVKRFVVSQPPGFMEVVHGAWEKLGANPQSLVFELSFGLAVTALYTSHAHNTRHLQYSCLYRGG